MLAFEPALHRANGAAAGDRHAGADEQQAAGDPGGEAPIGGGVGRKSLRRGDTFQPGGRRVGHRHGQIEAVATAGLRLSPRRSAYTPNG